uniref:SH3 domain-containing protein n=1 Tax=Gopherus agassizii TaxID=38772 RepID=A0A452I0L3_9SAUR
YEAVKLNPYRYNRDSFTKGDIIILRRKVDENWYHGELNGNHGFFPASYIQCIKPLPQAPPQGKALYDFEIKDKDQDKDSAGGPCLWMVNVNELSRGPPVDYPDGPQVSRHWCRSIAHRQGQLQAPAHQAHPQKNDELELRKGEMYRVIEKCQDGWFKGTSLRTGMSGVFPGNYVTPVSR